MVTWVLLSANRTHTTPPLHTARTQYGVVPMRAPVLVGLFIMSDLYFSLTSPESGTSHAGHLGGALCGALYALFLFSRRGRR
jgi:membrane associated rhomboid family serine protease